jgi:hypothetical protein
VIEKIHEVVTMKDYDHHKAARARVGTVCDRYGMNRVALELAADSLDKPHVLTMEADEVDELIEMLRGQAKIARKENGER